VRQTERKPQTDLVAAMREAMLPFMMPLLARLEALERVSMPPPPTAMGNRAAQSLPRANQLEDNIHPLTMRVVTTNTQPLDSQGDWVTVSCSNHRKKGKPGDSRGPQEGKAAVQINLMPASFANVTAKATHLPQKGGGQVASPQAPLVMEVTVLHSRGIIMDKKAELAIQAWPADAIA